MDSNAFVIQGKLLVVTQPSTTVAGATMTNVVVRVVDSNDAVIDSAVDAVTATMKTDGHAGATASAFTGGTATAATGGAATFNGIAISRNGPGFVLTFTATNMAADVDSSAFVIQGKLLVFTQPSVTVAGATMTNVVVKVVDTNDAVIDSAVDVISATIGVDPHSGGATTTLPDL